MNGVYVYMCMYDRYVYYTYTRKGLPLGGPFFAVCLARRQLHYMCVLYVYIIGMYMAHVYYIYMEHIQ